MLDWLTWPADLLLGAGGIVAGWFAERGAPRFEVIQMMVATLVLAAIVSTIGYWQSFSGYVADYVAKPRK